MTQYPYPPHRHEDGGVPSALVEEARALAVDPKPPASYNGGKGGRP
jgi:hypothetical protein